MKSLLDANANVSHYFWRQGTGSRAGYCRRYGFPKLVQGVLERGVFPERIDIRISLNFNDISAAIGNRSWLWRDIIRQGLRRAY